jgi:hypothetical protein
MKIKEIYIEKSRTISVDGIMGRDRYRKIVVGMLAEGENSDYEHLASLVDEAIGKEIEKMKCKKSQNEIITPKIKV